MRSIHAVMIEGDGIGPEVAWSAARVIEASGVAVEWDVRPAGQASLKHNGELVPEATLSAIRGCGAALKGPFFTPSGGSQRSPNWYIRRLLDLYACVRVLRTATGKIDILLVRENVEDLYGGIEWTASVGVVHAVKVATQEGCERIVRFAFELSRRKKRRYIVVVHKANNLKLTEGMLLDSARRIATEYPDIQQEDMLVDTAAALLVSAPERFDVLLMSNTFGDILSSVGAAVIGAIGLVPSANFGNGLVVTEALHGSADSLAGLHSANPLGMIGAGSMLLDALGFLREAIAIRTAIDLTCASGLRTPDWGGQATTEQVTQRVISHVLECLSRLPEAVV